MCRTILLGFLYGLQALPSETTPSKLRNDATTWRDSGGGTVHLTLKFIPKAGIEWTDIESIEFRSSLKPHLPLMKLEVVAAADDPASKFVTTRLANTEVASDAAFSKAMTWIEECIKGHERCPKNLRTELPTRMIDVRPSENLNQVKIFETTGQRNRYAALSYCWGGPQVVTSTVSTVDDNRKCIALSKLDGTIKDAVAVTRRLGILGCQLMEACPSYQQSELLFNTLFPSSLTAELRSHVNPHTNAHSDSGWQQPGHWQQPGRWQNYAEL